MRQAYIGVDVGTSSTRAGVFDEAGKLLATRQASDRDLARGRRHRRAVVLRHLGRLRGLGARRDGGGRDRAATAVKGIGFDATCSLVVLDRRRRAGHGQRIRRSRSATSSSGWIIARSAEAREINETRDDVLRYVGGSISPEMEVPKLLWLKRHLRASFDAAGHFFDLADFLSWRATGSLARSMCTVTCKWNYPGA